MSTEAPKFTLDDVGFSRAPDGRTLVISMPGSIADALMRAIATCPAEIFPELIPLGQRMMQAMPPAGQRRFLWDSAEALDKVIENHRARFIEIGEMTDTGHRVGTVLEAHERFGAAREQMETAIRNLLPDFDPDSEIAHEPGCGCGEGENK